MLIQQKMLKPNCLTYSAAMVMNVPAEVLEKEIGTDGTEEIWEDLEGYSRLRGIHIQEIIDCALLRGFAPVLLERTPILSSNDDRTFEIFKPEKENERFLQCIENCEKGILINSYHAMAYSDGVIYDPRGYSFKITKNVKDTCFMLVDFKEIK